LSENAKEEEAPKENEAFDYSALPERFYFEVETVGSVSPQEVVLKVGESAYCHMRKLNR
jgi:DNA-directed RNA polymerase II subunit RPB3